ncbi:30709_t:CDS:2, partial [Racocetra persica]
MKQQPMIKLSQTAIFRYNNEGLPEILLAQRINPNKIYYSWYGIPGGKQEYTHETFERIAERETLEETGILIYQEKLIEIGHSYYPPKDTNGYNTTKEEEVDSKNKEQFEKLDLPNFTLDEATDFINKSFENIQPIEVYQ